MGSTRNNQRLEDLARALNPTMWGWAKYYGRFYRSKFLQVLRHTDNNLTQAARLLGISRVTLRNKLAALGIAIERSSSVEEEETA